MRDKEKQRRANAAYRERHREEIRIKNREYSRKNKDILRDKSRQYRKDHPEKAAISVSAKHQRLKQRVFDMYGQCCRACQTREPAVLSVDHIFGSGCKDRKRIREQDGRGFYANILDKKRDDLQILCMNCQLMKERYGNDFKKWPKASSSKQLSNLDHVFIKLMGY